MNTTPTPSAQEAALTAVNLGPAVPADPSSATTPLPTESLTITYALLILSRDQTGEPTWFACKFCPIFGCKVQREGYLRLYRAPFSHHRIEQHLKRDHPVRWDEYRPLSPEQKCAYFQGHKLPPPTVFQNRMHQLEKAWSPAPGKRKPNKAELAPTSQKPVKRPRVLSIIPDITYEVPLLSCDEDWFGRRAFRLSQEEHTASESASSYNYRKFPRSKHARPGPNVYNHLGDVLSRYSDPFSADLSLLVHHANEAPMRDVPVTPPWIREGGAALAVRAFFYFLRGFPVDVTSRLLQGCLEAAQPGSDVEMLDGSESHEPRDLVISEHLKGIASCNPPEDWMKSVSDVGEAVEMAAFQALKRILAHRQGWALALTTRRCPVRKDALQILIPMHPPASESNTESKSDEHTPPTDLPSQPENETTGSAPSDAMDVGSHTEKVAPEQDIVEMFTSELISLAVTVFLLAEECERANIKGEERVSKWVRARVKLCLENALEFFSEIRGSERAKSALKGILDVRKLQTNWVMSEPTEDVLLEQARSNYQIAGCKVSNAQWEKEKLALRTLRSCIRMAKDAKDGGVFNSPTMCAREILSKALTDFDKFVPVKKKAPAVHDPVHLISMVESPQAAETVTRLLDFVCPQWPARLIGIHSNVSTDSPLKPLEKKLVEALKERKGSDLTLVDKAALGSNKPPMMPNELVKMTPPQFDEFVNSYIKDSASVEDGFLQQLKAQHECLRGKKMKKIKNSFAEHDDLRDIMTFVQGLQLLWTDNFNKQEHPCRFSGVVCDYDDAGHRTDREIERVFRARTLIGVEQIELLDKEGKERHWTNISAWKDYLIAWDGNWSNLF